MVPGVSMISITKKVKNRTCIISITSHLYRSNANKLFSNHCRPQGGLAFSSWAASCHLRLGLAQVALPREAIGPPWTSQVGGLLILQRGSRLGGLVLKSISGREETVVWDRLGDSWKWRRMDETLKEHSKGIWEFLEMRRPWRRETY
jgi:hypothetical protein